MKASCRHAALVRYVTLRSLQSHYPPGPKTVSVAFTDAGPISHGHARTKPTFKARIKLLTVVSMDQPYKGLSDLLESFGSLLQKGYDLSLSIAGTGRLKSHYEAISRQYGARVIFHGHLDAASLSSLYAVHDLFVLASWTEGFPRALLEAMAYGLPCVATDVGDTSTMIGSDQIARPRDPQSLTATLEHVLDLTDTEWRMLSSENLTRAMLIVRHAEGQRATLESAMSTLLDRDR